MHALTRVGRFSPLLHSLRSLRAGFFLYAFDYIAGQEQAVVRVCCACTRRMKLAGQGASGTQRLRCLHAVEETCCRPGPHHSSLPPPSHHDGHHLVLWPSTDWVVGWLTGVKKAPPHNIDGRIAKGPAQPKPSSCWAQALVDKRKRGSRRPLQCQAGSAAVVATIAVTGRGG